ncbi:MAG TPA: hypothetical protein VNK70_01290 [Candidatus Paceibacterota bacterium]|nr:hypothetical protein [Candidatus Paceibacterota bacterium]
MKPVFVKFFYPVIAHSSGETVAIVGATRRDDPVEPLLLWGYRPCNEGLFAFEPRGGTKVSLVLGVEYRPAYRKAVAALSDRYLAFAAGSLLGAVAPQECWYVRQHNEAAPVADLFALACREMAEAEENTRAWREALAEEAED